MYFITDTFKSQINDILKNLFKNLNKSDINFLLNYVLNIINHIASCYGFPKNPIYYKQFLKNNGQDTKSICLQLLPFVKNFDFDNLN